MDFKLHAPYSATGDQPEAIRKLTEGVRLGLDEQVLLGVTGSGKTFTMASVIANLNRPTLVLAHNKTLAAQLCSEFREFFPENAVEYFISYYDYYQPEAYIAHTDTYIEKDSAINDEIERLRHSATSSLFERRDVIVVSSVSCIYGLGDPIDYKNMVISLRTGMEKSREELMQKLVEIRYERNDLNFTRNTFRVRGDTVEIYPVYWSGRAIRVEFFGDEIDRISEINAVSGMPERVISHVPSTPPRTTSPRGTSSTAPFSRSSARWRSASAGSRSTTSCLRPSASASARCMTSRCCRRSASAAALKTTPASFPAVRPARRP